MMQPLTLKEFAENLRMSGDWREMEFGDEILELITLEEDVAEPYSELCDDIVHGAPDDLKDKPAKALERIINRSDILDEIEKALAERIAEPRDADDEVKALLSTLDQAEDILEEAGWIDCDFIQALTELAERAARAPEEIMEYDL